MLSIQNTQTFTTLLPHSNQFLTELAVKHTGKLNNEPVKKNNQTSNYNHIIYGKRYCNRWTNSN